MHVLWKARNFSEHSTPPVFYTELRCVVLLFRNALFPNSILTNYDFWRLRERTTSTTTNFCHCSIPDAIPPYRDFGAMSLHRNTHSQSPKESHTFCTIDNLACTRKSDPKVGVRNFRMHAKLQSHSSESRRAPAIFMSSKEVQFHLCRWVWEMSEWFYLWVFSFLLLRKNFLMLWGLI